MVINVCRKLHWDREQRTLKKKGKAVKWGISRKAGVGREAKLLSCCGWVAGAGEGRVVLT